MDVFTHFVLPYLLVWALGRPPRERIAAGIGGYAPDIDVLSAPLAALVEPLYFLGHRGVSHTLVGAPLHALVLVGLLWLPWWTRVTPRAEALRFGPRLALLAVVASYTHLALDWTTMWGVAVLYPWSFERFTSGWYFYSVTWAIPVGGYFVWRLARGTANDRVLRRTGAILVVVLLTAGAVRAATFPGEPEGGRALPASGEWQWTTLAPTEAGWNATFYSWGRPVGNATYASAAPATPEAERALARAKDAYAYKDFRLYAGGPEVVQVEPRPERDGGGWNVTFLDLMQRTQVDRSSGFLADLFGDRGTLKLLVTPEGEVRERED